MNLTRITSNQVTYDQGGTGSSVRLLKRKLQEHVSVFDFMTEAQIACVKSGTYTVDVPEVNDEVQAALNYCGNHARLYFPAGTYLISSALTLPSYSHLEGESWGYGASIIKGSGASIFTFVSLADCTFEYITFTATVNNVAAFKQSTLEGNYTSNCLWYRCNFLETLTECIYANLILCTVEFCVFGYYGGTVSGQTARRHIYSQGSVGYDSNINFILRNRFYNALGAESVRFEYGRGLYIEGNNFEAGSARSCTILGMFNVDIQRNWFENCNDATSIIYLGNSVNVVSGNYNVTINHNFFTTATSLPIYILTTAGNTTIAEFNNNFGAGAFTAVDSSGTANIIESKNTTWGSGSIATPLIKNVVGGAWTPTFASQGGSIATASSVGTYNRANGIVTFNCQITAGAVSSPTGTLQITGLPSTAAIDTVVSILAINANALPAGAQFIAYAYHNNNSIIINYFNNGGSGNGDGGSYVQSGTVFYVSGSYVG